MLASLAASAMASGERRMLTFSILSTFSAVGFGDRIGGFLGDLGDAGLAKVDGAGGARYLLDGLSGC